jgi:hypothetical protein
MTAVASSTGVAEADRATARSISSEAAVTSALAPAHLTTAFVITGMLTEGTEARSS